MYNFKTKKLDLETFALNFNDKYFTKNDISSKSDYISKIYTNQLNEHKKKLSSADYNEIYQRLEYIKNNLSDSVFDFLLENYIILDDLSLYLFILTVNDILFFKQSGFNDRVENYDVQIKALKKDANYIQSFSPNQIKISIPLPPQSSIVIFKDYLKCNTDSHIFVEIIVNFLSELSNYKRTPNSNNQIAMIELNHYKTYKNKLWNKIKTPRGFQNRLKKSILDIIGVSQEIYLPDIKLATYNHYTSNNNDEIHTIMNEYKMYFNKKYKFDLDKSILSTIKHDLTYEAFSHLLNHKLLMMEPYILYIFISTVGDINFFEKQNFSEKKTNYAREIDKLKNIANNLQRFSAEQITIKLPVRPDISLKKMVQSFDKINLDKDVKEKFLSFFNSYLTTKDMNDIPSYSPNIELSIVPP